MSAAPDDPKVVKLNAVERIVINGGPLDHARKFVELEHSHREGRWLHRHRGGFHAWTGTHYRELAIEEAREAAYRFYERCRKRRSRRQRDVEYVPVKPNRRMISDFVDALMAAAFVRDDVPAPSWLGSHGPAGLIPLRNGMLELATDRLLPHSPRLLRQLQPAVRLRPASSRADRVAALPGQHLARGSGRDRHPAGNHGPAADQRHAAPEDLSAGRARSASAKGTIARIIRLLLGAENVAGPTLSGLTMNFGLQELIGKPAAIIADARLSGRSDAAVIAERLLSISGEDVQTIDRKHRDPWTGMLPTRFVIMTNQLPKIADTSGALASRFIILTMTRSFYGSEDHGLLDRLLAELPGIFAWALAGCRSLAERGRLVMPAV